MDEELFVYCGWCRKPMYKKIISGKDQIEIESISPEEYVPPHKISHGICDICYISLQPPKRK